jgi:alpha-D-ribose 1-methylphosphonate 5-triphosphate synthase subunit PhnH
MTFDAVHDTQRIFRKLLRAHSFPGTIVDIGPDTRSIETWATMSTALTGIALTLLDAETTFCVWPGRSSAEEDFLSHLTYGRRAPAAAAGFHFLTGGREAEAALQAASVGTLVEPHLGATLIVEVGGLDEAGPWVLRGPGISNTARLGVTGFDDDLVGLRAERCSEYPLGVDLVFVDAEGRCAAIPRTTRVQVEA